MIPAHSYQQFIMNTHRLHHIDVWRFIAIFMVIVSHIIAFSHPWYAANVAGVVWRLEPIGTVGVQIFFCISGYVICRGLMREASTPAGISLRGFFIRRAHRILPPLFLYIAVVAVLNALGAFNLQPAQFLQAATFLCNLGPKDKCGWELGHTWSLAYEEQFYLAFPFLVIWLGLAARRDRLVLILGGLAAVSLALTLSVGKSFAGEYVGHFICMLSGCTVALYWDRLQPMLARTSVTTWFFAALLVIGVNAVALPQFFREVIQPILLPPLICVAVFGTPHGHPLLRRFFLSPLLSHLGRISYGVYLWQQLATGDYGFDSPFVSLALLGGVFVLAHFSYTRLEVPLMNVGARRAAAKPVHLPAAAPTSADVGDEELANSR